LAVALISPIESPLKMYEALAPTHLFDDVRLTRNRLATSRSLAPASIISAASSRTFSLPAAPLLRSQPAAIGVPHNTGIPPASDDRQGP
jgi:hypothetical protein